MSFSSPGFLFAFLPLAVLVHLFIAGGTRNLWLLLASLAFYSIDGGKFTLILILSIILNHYAALAIHGSAGATRKSWAIAATALNLLPLIYYKYWTFLTGIEQTILPAGISFYTFQGISYVIDVYRRDVEPARRLVDFGAYHTLFPQLIAGPIVRYVEVSDAINGRKVTAHDIEHGILRFCAGLGKKILIADPVGAVADQAFGLPPDQVTTAIAWTGALCFTLQIYFDFSGYSDMAIGLGRMLGFRFPENFASPYRSRSITEFWRRWHMTLSRWFRDYVYIPLGGNRAGPWRTYFNLFAVFALCGLWHGAAWTFVAWGVYHGMLLVIERVARNRFPGFLVPTAAAWPATMLLVIVGWVMFRAATFSQAAIFYKAMAGFGASAPNVLLTNVRPDQILFFALGVVLSLTSIVWVYREAGIGSLGRGVQRLLALFLLAYSSIMIAANGFNPFIYFRF